MLLIAASLQALSGSRSAIAAGEASGSFYLNNTYGSSPNKTVSIDVAGLGPGTGDFTYELWFKNMMDSATNVAKISTDIIGTRDGFTGGANGSGFDLFYEFNDSWAKDPRIIVYQASPDNYGAGYQAGLTTGRPAPRTWNHIAFVRSSGVGKIFLNGALITSGADTRDFGSSRITLGEKWPLNNEGGFQGYMSNFRYVKGIAVYTGNFSVPTSPLTRTQSAGTNIAAIVSNTATQVLLNTPNSAGSFLTDSSSFGRTMSNNNGVVASSQSPFDIPTVSSLSVTSGDFAGGTTSTLTGTNLGSTSRIMVGTETATGLTINSSTSVSFITPAGTQGVKDVTAVTDFGNFTLSNSYTYVKTPQTISYSSRSGLVVGEARTLTATATSGLAVTYSSSTPSVCSISGDKVTALSDGSCTISISQSGNASFASATSTITFTVTTTARNNDEQDALVLALAGVAVGVASMMADVTTIATSMKSCYRGKITKKVMKNKACPKGYSTKKIKVSGS